MRGLIAFFTIPLLLMLGGAVPLPEGPAEAPQGLPTISLSVKKVGQVWKVVQTGTTNTDVRAKKGQKIIFSAEGTDVYFQFGETGLFGGHTKYLQNGKTLNLVVGNVANGTYVYAAFCLGPKEYAEGGSPPKIIVD